MTRSLVVDAHVHAARLGSLKLDWQTWISAVGDEQAVGALYGDDGVLDPGRFDAIFEAEGVDRVMLFCEYSPRVTGTQAIEDMLGRHACKPDSEMAYTAREYVFNARKLVAQVFRRMQDVDPKALPSRRQAEEWRMSSFLAPCPYDRNEN